MTAKIKRALGILLTLALLLGLTLTANAESTVDYLDAYHNLQSASAWTITSGSTSLSTGWYAVTENTTISGRVTVSGSVHLILCDNVTLTASQGITVEGSNSLTIYSQSLGSNTGKLNATGVSNEDDFIYPAGIGGYNNAGGTIIINGGTIYAKGAVGEWGGGAGIGGSYAECNYVVTGLCGANVTINGGYVTAIGGTASPGIGDGPMYAMYETSVHPFSSVTINGGTVTATGNSVDGGGGGAGIGGGYGGHGVNVTVNGGTVKAIGGRASAGIGDGCDYPGEYAATITVNGGTVTATGGNGGEGYVRGAGIGGAGPEEGQSAQVNQNSWNRGRIVIDVNAVTIYAGSSSDNMPEVPYTHQLPGFGFRDYHMQQYVMIKEKPVAVTEVTLDPTSLTLTVDGQETLTASVAPDKATDKTVIWSVGGTNGDAVKLYTDENCTTEVGTEATETLTVYVKAMSAGEATVTVTSNADNTKLASCAVTVSEPHVHSFEYSADGATVTATCTEEGCDLDDGTEQHNPAVSLTIAAPTLTAYGQTGDGISADATLTGLEAFNTATGLTVSADSIQYFQAVKNDDTYTKGDSLDGAPTDAGDYLAEISAGTESNTATASVCYTIARINPTVTAPTGLTATYGQTLGDVTLENPEGNMEGEWAWADGTDTSVGDVGEHTFKANFTPNDTTNYNSVTNVDVTVTVEMANPTANAPTGLTATYGQKLKDVALENPEGNTEGAWEWVDDAETSVGDAGSHTFKANFTPEDTANYNSVTNVDVTVTVEMANPIANAPEATATYGQKLKDVALENPEGNTEGTWEWVDDAETSVGDAGSHTFKANFTPNDTTNYNSVTDVDVTVTVDRIDPIANAPTGLTATYGQKLKDVTLENPEGNTEGEWAWANDTLSVGNAGQNTFTVNFTPSDTTNYNSVSNIEVTVTVDKADPTANAPEATATYGQKLKDVTLENPEGNTEGAWEWADDEDTSVGSVGEHTFKANFTPNDTTNYNSVTNVDVTVTVEMANPTANAPEATATYGQKLKDVALENPEGNTEGTWEWVDDAETSVGDAGSHTFKANFTPNDTTNYNSVTNVDVTVTVDRIDPIANAPTGLTATYGQTLKDVTLENPEGNTEGEWAWANDTLSVGSAGQNTFTVNFTPSDTTNYNSVSNIEVTVTVDKADPTANAPEATATYGQTLKDVALENPEGNTEGTWAWADDTLSVGSAGNRTFIANFTPKDTANYNNKTNVEVTVIVGQADNPAIVTDTATVMKGGNTVDLSDNVDHNGATGTVSYAISGNKNGCTLNGSVLTSGTNTGTVTVYVSITATDNYFALPQTPITVTITEKNTQTIGANDVTAAYGDTDKSVSASVTEPATGTGEISFAVKAGSEDYIEVDAATGALTFKKTGTAYVTVTAAETLTCAQATAEVTVTISMGDPIAIAPTGLTATYGQTLGDVTLENPEGNTEGTWEWVDDADTSVGSVGSHTFKANFTPTDTNYNAVEDVDVTVTVSAPAFGPATFKLPASTKTVGESAFEGLPMTIVEIPSGCESIGKWAFKDCTSLTQIRIPASVTTIDTTAFDGCVNVFIYGAVGSAAETFCGAHDNCTFVPEDAGE